MWSLVVQHDVLLSCSADDSVKLWSIEDAQCKHSYSNEANGTPNDVAFHKEQNKVLITWTHQILTIVDIEAGLSTFTRLFFYQNSGTEIMKFENCVDVNSLSMHPSLPIAVTAHDDRNIRFWDLQRYFQFKKNFFKNFSAVFLFILWWRIWKR